MFCTIKHPKNPFGVKALKILHAIDRKEEIESAPLFEGDKPTIERTSLTGLSYKLCWVPMASG